MFMKRLLTLFTFLFISGLGFSQQSSKPQKREKIWVYDVNIIRDETGRIVKVEKTVFCKGTSGAATRIRYFETKERRDAAGNIMYSTRERIGENNVDPEILKQYGNDSNNSSQQENK